MSLTPPNGTPPAPGAEREEPEPPREDDIPSDDGTVRSGEEPAPEQRPLREVERE